MLIFYFFATSPRTWVCPPGGASSGSDLPQASLGGWCKVVCPWVNSAPWAYGPSPPPLSPTMVSSPCPHGKGYAFSPPDGVEPSPFPSCCKECPGWAGLLPPVVGWAIWVSSSPRSTDISLHPDMMHWASGRPGETLLELILPGCLRALQHCAHAHEPRATIPDDQVIGGELVCATTACAREGPACMLASWYVLQKSTDAIRYSTGIVRCAWWTMQFTSKCSPLSLSPDPCCCRLFFTGD